MEKKYNIFISTYGLFNLFGYNISTPSIIKGLTDKQLKVLETSGWKYNIVEDTDFPTPIHTTDHNQNSDSGTIKNSFQIDIRNSGPKIYNKDNVLQIINFDGSLGSLQSKVLIGEEGTFGTLQSGEVKTSFISSNNIGTTGRIIWDSSNGKWKCGIKNSETEICFVGHGNTHGPLGTDPIPSDKPSIQECNSFNSKGTKDSYALSDHVHGFLISGVPSSVTNQTASPGSSGSFCPMDHKHPIGSHSHENGNEGGQIQHSDLVGSGVNSHTDIDNFIAGHPFVSHFNGLMDTPNSYAGQGGKIVAVDGTENGISFVDNNFVKSDGTISMSAPLTLSSSNPITVNHATRKKYVDDFFDANTGHNHNGTNSRRISYHDLVNQPWPDFAEMMENGIGDVILPGSIITITNGKVVPAEKNDIMMGVISPNPQILLGNPQEDPTKHEYNIWGEVIGENPNYVERGYIERKDRPKEWCSVALIGQVRVRVRENVKVDDYIIPYKNGIGSKSRKPSRIKVLKKLKPDLALCILLS